MNFKKKLLIILVILFIVFLLLYVFKIQNVILKQIYPLKYTEWVEKYAKEYDVDDLLIYAIIKAEKCRVDRIEEVFVDTKEEEIHELLMEDDKEFDNENLSEKID